MKISRKSIITASLAVTLAAAVLLGGGTYAYLEGQTEDTVINFQPHKVMVELNETTGGSYHIIPGTTQAKDPTVTVDNTVDAYVYVEVTDATDGLVDYEMADGWIKLAGYDNIYYREVAKHADVRVFPILKDNIVSYDAALENSDMLEEDGTTLKDGITLAFKALAIQKTPFDDPKDAYEEMVPANSTLAVNLTYSQENNPQSPKFFAESIQTEDSTLFQVGNLKPHYPDSGFYRGCTYTFTIKGSSDKDMALTFDFAEKCGAGESYKGSSFEYGFGGFGDTFLLAGTYPDFAAGQYTEADGTFELVGDYYPVVLTVTSAEGNTIDFHFTGSLTALVKALSANPCILKADTEYEEEFTITMNWPLQTMPTDICHVLKDGVMDPADTSLTIGCMDRADTVIGSVGVAEALDTYYEAGKIGVELWADFEILIQKAPYTKP